MGDRCWLNITFPRVDLPKFNEVLADRMWKGQFWDEEDGDDSKVNAIIYEANYGWYDEVQALAEAGLTFTVSHGAGGEYGPCVYACYEGDLVGCSADWEGNPVAPVYKDGVDRKALEACMKYHQLVEMIQEESQGGTNVIHNNI